MTYIFPAYTASVTDSLLHKVISLILSATDDKTKQMDEYNSFTGLWTWSPTETEGCGSPNCSAAKTEGQNAAQDQSVPAYKNLFQETKCALGLMLFHFFLGLLYLL